MFENEVVFSIARHAAWAPGVTSPERWDAWARAPWPLASAAEPKVAARTAMTRTTRTATPTQAATSIPTAAPSPALTPIQYHGPMREP